ncbi:MAG: hypothetical protein FJ293_05785 [Planctomycetes bacterium]|nr:hypothetical protein [Planctomycetota bacterium]
MAVLLGVEGGICLAMALPPALSLAGLGALVGAFLQDSPRSGRAACVAPLLLAPLLQWLEARFAEPPPRRTVTTAVVVAAPPERVWELVVAFPPIPEPTDWLFRSGIAYPQRAEIIGKGVGAVRHCVFSTGAFVEPIDCWERRRRLGFAVTAQPPPMREWSPWSIAPLHLKDFLVSERG